MDEDMINPHQTECKDYHFESAHVDGVRKSRKVYKKREYLLVTNFA